MPRNPLWGTLLILVLSGPVSNASAQSHNFGYYEETYRDSNMAIYDLVWSDYIPGVEDEPVLPDDFYIPPDGVIGGGGCSSAMDPECTHPQAFTGGGGEASIQSSDGITDRITVYYQNGGDIGLAVRALVAWSGDSSGGISWEPGSAIGRGTKEVPPPPCNSGDPEIDGNQNVWTDLWDETNVAEKGATRFQRERSIYKNSVTEQGAFILPNGQIQRVKVGATLGVGNNTTVVQFVEADACNLEFGPVPTNWPEGTVFVHAHPWAAGDDQSAACGVTGKYKNGPGEMDAPFLQATGIALGLVLDLNGIYSYDADENVKKESDVCY